MTIIQSSLWLLYYWSQGKMQNQRQDRSHNLYWTVHKGTYIFSLSLPSTVSVACRSLKRSCTSRSGKILSGVLGICTLDSAMDCSAKFPRDTMRGLHSVNTLFHTLWLYSRVWKLFLRAWWSGVVVGLDILRADFRHRLTSIKTACVPCGDTFHEIILF